MSASARLLAKAGVTTLLLWLLWRQLDIAAVAALYREIHPAWLTLILVSTAGLVVADGATLAAAMRAKGFALSYRSAALYSFVGWFFGNVAPSTVGADVFRVMQIRNAGAPIGTAVRVTLAARLMSSLGLTLVLLAGLPAAIFLVSGLVEQAVIAMIALGALASTAMLLALSRHLPMLAARVARPWFDKLVAAAADLREVALGRQIRAQAWASAVAQHAFRIVTLIGLDAALGLGIPWLAIAALAPPALLVAMVPVSLGSWGVREGAFVLFFAMAGIAPEKALALSVALGLLRLLMGFVAGLVWLLARRSGFGFERREVAGELAVSDRTVRTGEGGSRYLSHSSASSP